MKTFIAVLLVGLVAVQASSQSHGELKKLSTGHALRCRLSAEERAITDEMFRQLNAYRRAKGKRALLRDFALEECIEAHCHHMWQHKFFSHNAPEAAASDPWKRAAACGTWANAENIAYGYPTVSQVMSAWKGSPGHNTNMLNNNYTRVGCGYFKAKPHWGQLFATGAVKQSKPSP